MVLTTERADVGVVIEETEILCTLDLVMELVSEACLALGCAVLTEGTLSEHRCSEASPLSLAVESMVMVMVGCVSTLSGVCWAVAMRHTL
jgi:hypothetical protein